MKVITISREYGAGGHSIGQKVAEELGIPFYDKDIVRETIKASGYEQDVVENQQEDIPHPILRTISNISSIQFNDTQGAIHDLQRAAILNFAHQGPCVILGRCADVILNEAGVDSLNVFIYANPINRAMRMSEMTGIKNATTLQKELAKKDRGRHTYYTTYTGKKWGDARNYTISLDSGLLGYETCVKLIVEAAKADK